jgi:hypothetical protein
MRSRVSKTFRREVKKALPLDVESQEELAKTFEQYAQDIRDARLVTAVVVGDQEMAKGPLISDQFLSWYPHKRRLEISLTFELWAPVYDEQEWQ